MVRHLLLCGAALCMATATQAQLMLGKATAVDGDSIIFGNSMIRLSAIDALELKQSCSRGGEVWACGEAAKAHLQSLLDRGSLNCRQVDTDQYKRQVSVCSVGRLDLGSAMIAAGYAVSLGHASDVYRLAEGRARDQRTGMWGWEFEIPAEYRAADSNFVQLRPPDPPKEQRADRIKSEPDPTVYFRSCAEAWRAGVAPIRRGEPGYRPGLDGDNDGVACEPFRRRRG